MSRVAQMSILETLTDNFHGLPHYHPEETKIEVNFTFSMETFINNYKISFSSCKLFFLHLNKGERNFCHSLERPSISCYVETSFFVEITTITNFLWQRKQPNTMVLSINERSITPFNINDPIT